MKNKIIVIGGGFAGIEFIKNLDENSFEVLLIDKVNHHQFQPLFYQVATSQLEPSSISFPLRKIFKGRKNLQIRVAEVLSVDTINNKIQTTIGTFEFDYLVLATGCKTNFFGKTDIAKNVLTLKTTNDAINIRNHILQTFEKILSADTAEKESLFNLVIVGAGPTGVELAGAFAEIKKNILPKDYPGVDFTKFKVIIVEGSPNTLNNMSTNAQSQSKKYLKNMGVILHNNTYVEKYDGTQLTFMDGTVIQTKSVIWATGVVGNTLKGLDKKQYGPAARLLVDRYHALVGLPTIFALGDIALMTTPKYPNGHPQLANVAVKQAQNLAKNFNQILQHSSRSEFEYNDVGSLATIGRNKAVVDLPFLKFSGYFAWLFWMFLHLMLILNVKNKLIIFINWAWAYVHQDTSLRLILIPNQKTQNEIAQN
jgi:NADH:ubiquinone reductase (H+-translocating)